MSEARERAEAAERKPGMTPYRRGLGKLFVAPLTGVIAVELADPRRLPNGRLGKFLQIFTHRELALMALGAVLPQIGRPLRSRDEESFERAIKEAIGEIFYANIRLRKATLSDSKRYRRRIRWREAALQGTQRRRRGESVKEWRERLRKALPERVTPWLIKRLEQGGLAQAEAERQAGSRRMASSRATS